MCLCVCLQLHKHKKDKGIHLYKKEEHYRVTYHDGKLDIINTYVEKREK